MEINNTDKIKGLKVVHFALIMGLVFFTLITIIINTINKEGFILKGENLGQFVIIMLVVVNILAIGSIMAGITIAKRKNTVIKDKPISEKLDEYRESMIIRSATMEAPGFFFLVTYLLTANHIALLEAIIIIGIMIIYFPSKSRIAADISEDERELI